jgi:hypothetical protein
LWPLRKKKRKKKCQAKGEALDVKNSLFPQQHISSKTTNPGFKYNHGCQLGIQAAIQKWVGVMGSVPFTGPISDLRASIAFN